MFFFFFFFFFLGGGGGAVKNGYGFLCDFHLQEAERFKEMLELIYADWFSSDNKVRVIVMNYMKRNGALNCATKCDKG